MDYYLCGCRMRGRYYLQEKKEQLNLKRKNGRLPHEADGARLNNHVEFVSE
jgi:hypothetical protein